MIYTNFVGRIGKDAKVIDGKNGKFMYFDVAVSDYYKGKEVTTWMRVFSNNQINLAKYLTKGKMILVEGQLSKPSIYVDKQSVEHVQLATRADLIHFVNSGKRKDNALSAAETPVETTKEGTPKDDDPLGAPNVGEDGAPF